MRNALRLFDEVLAEHPTNSFALCGRGDVLQDQGSFDLALAAYEKAMAVEFRYDPDGLPVKAGALELLRDGQSGLPVATTLGQLQDHATYDSFGAISSYDAAHGTRAARSGD